MKSVRLLIIDGLYNCKQMYDAFFTMTAGYFIKNMNHRKFRSDMDYEHEGIIRLELSVYQTIDIPLTKNLV